MGRLPKERKAILVTGAFFLAAFATAVVPAPLRAAPAARSLVDLPKRLQLAALPGYEIQSFPVLEALQSDGRSLAPDSKEWMKRWKGMNLEDSSSYKFKELS